MATSVPSVQDIKERLQPLDYGQLEALERDSGVPFHTLLKLRSGETKNPRIGTVRAIWPHLRKPQKAKA